MTGPRVPERQSESQGRAEWSSRTRLLFCSLPTQFDDTTSGFRVDRLSHEASDHAPLTVAPGGLLVCAYGGERLVLTEAAAAGLDPGSLIAAPTRPLSARANQTHPILAA
jgi:hypothetical protein